MKSKLPNSSFGSAAAWLFPRVSLAVGILIVTEQASYAQILAGLTDAGASNPTQGALDIAQIGITGNQELPDGVSYNTADQSSYGIGEAGQTFVTGTNSDGYTATSLFIKSGGLGDNSRIGTAQNYVLHFYSVNGSNATPLASYTSAPFAFVDGDWLEWSSLSVPLAANATYAYSFGLGSSATGYEPLAVANGNPYTGGEMGLFPPAGGAITYGTSHYFDAAFDVVMAAGGGLPGVFQVSVSPGSNVFIGTPVTFTASVSGAKPLFLQWQFNGGNGFSNIAGASGNTLSLTAELTNNGAYQLVLTNVFGATTSTPVTLSVTQDTNPPTVVAAAFLSVTEVNVQFSKLLEPASATNIANYAFTNGLEITEATLGTNGMSVVLTTSPLTLGSNYTLVVNGVRDEAIPPNTIAADSSISFVALPFTSQDIGSPPNATAVTITSSNSAVITSDGKAIGGTSDQMSLNYQLVTGDFDVAVRVASLGDASLWAQAGLMARASLISGSPYAASLATPGVNGDSFSYRATTNGGAGSTGHFPVNYPNTWLRVSRTTNLFTGYGSYDGTNWTQLGSATIPMPSQIYLGLALTSGATPQPVTANFMNFQTTPAGAVLATQANPNEPLGPSARTTGIAISEIMWKPAPRADSNNVEFIELYNSYPYFQDISGYTVSCADMSYTFAPNTLIPAGAFYVLAASPESIANVYGLTSNVFGYSGSLKKAETLQLLDERSNVLLTVPYSGVYPWPVAAGGTGHSIVLANPTYGEGDPRAWAISDRVGGSPGQMDSFSPSPLRNVVINEILPHTENPAAPQFIELYNHSTTSVNVSGCVLTDDTTTNKFVIPSGTVIAPAGFVSFGQSQFGFTLDGQGETLYFINPDNSRVIDAVQFGAQGDGISWGRWPDGANDFYAFTANTPGTNNSPILIGDIVLNELMYDPISGNDDDQYIELYNQGTNAVDLAGWQFTAGVNYTFPANSVIGPNGYIVVGKNTANLFAHYTNLSSANTYGNYSGKLSHSGELVELAQPQSYFGTNTIYVSEDQVTYGTGGRWGQWSGGGGSSLELIDPHSNHRLAANWADSDETQKSQWVQIVNTGVLDNGANYGSTIDYVQLGLLDSGECLVDNIEVDFGGVNYISNGTFDSTGLTGWSLQGCMTRSTLESSGYQSANSLHVRCSDKIWTGVNSCEGRLTANTLTYGQTVTMKFQARWLHGWPEALMRLHGNWLEATGALPVPANLGSPGAPNSQYITNAGPAVYNVTHTPSLPAARQPVVVTAQAHDPDGIANLTLFYRLDPTTAYTQVTMNDSGTSGDAIAGDGIYSATIPGQVANQVVAFYIAATDKLGAATRFPSLRPGNNEPARECLVMFGDGNPGGSFGVYHLWITRANVLRWANLSDLSNEGNDCTFVNDNRVIYNLQGRFAGSPYHQIFTTPVDPANLCHYKWEFNDDDKFLGATDFNKIHQPGNGPGDDASDQREQCANTFLRALGVPWLNRRFVAVYVNGSRRGTLMEDAQCPGGDVVKEHYPNDSGGFLFKMQPWFEMAPTPSGDNIGYNNMSWCTLEPFTTTGGVLKKAFYRYMFEMRRTPDSANDYTNIFSLVNAANTFGEPNYVASMENIADMENWMRVFAANHAAGNWDSFGAQNQQNMYGYIGTQDIKYSLHMWDFNIVLGNSGSWSPGENLTYVPYDYATQLIYYEPTFERMFWRAMQELVNGPLTVANSGPLMVAKYNAIKQNGMNVENPTGGIETFLTQAKTSIASQVAANNVSSFSVTTPPALSGNVAYISGQAPLNVDFIYINGVAYPLTWTGLTTWTIAMPLTNGANHLSIVGISHAGQPVAGTSNQLTVNYTQAIPSPVGHVVINEIMYNPPVAGAQYVELYNNSASIAYDLSGWQIAGLSYTFPQGALLPPFGYIALTGNRAAFAGAYGSTEAVFDTFSAPLAPGQLLSLERPIGGTNQVVAEVQFDNVLPWPANAGNPGVSLQLVDATQDNWRAGNWSAAETNTPPAAVPQWVEAVATGQPTTSLLYIYLQSAGDVYVDDIKVVAGSVPDVGANLLTDGDFESGFPGPWKVSPNLTGSALSTTVKHSGNASLHLVSTAAGTTQASAIYQTMSPALPTTATYTISYWYLQSTNGGPLTVRLSGSGISDTVYLAPPPAVPEALFTPDAANSVAESLPAFAPLWINEVEPKNLTGITNSAGQHVPWVEIYNPTTNTVSLANLWLGTNYTDLDDWEFPSGAVVKPGQFLVVFADGKTNLSTLTELHASFALGSPSGSIALSRLISGQPQVLDYVNYNNMQPDWSYGSIPDGQSFVRQAFFSPTPGNTNGDAGVPPSSFIAYSSAGSIYAQTFDSLPDPGAASVNTANPVTIDGATYSLANPFDFAFPAMTNGGTGGLGFASLAGWYGSSALLSRFGATDGDQTTGGQISFGLPNDSNRALGLLATSTTGSTAFGAKFVNNTGGALKFITAKATGELWRQSNLPKTLQCYYSIDPTAIAPMPAQATAFLPELNVVFPTDAGDAGGVAVDGTFAANQTGLAANSHAITNWPAGAALWLVWQMTDATGKAQGLAIDNLSFSATAEETSTNSPVVLNLQTSPSSPFVISWPASANGYQLYSATNLEPPVVWTPVSAKASETNGTFYLPILPTNAGQFFRLSTSP